MTTPTPAPAVPMPSWFRDAVACARAQAAAQARTTARLAQDTGGTTR